LGKVKKKEIFTIFCPKNILPLYNLSDKFWTTKNEESLLGNIANNSSSTNKKY